MVHSFFSFANFLFGGNFIFRMKKLCRYLRCGLKLIWKSVQGHYHMSAAIYPFFSFIRDLNPSRVHVFSLRTAAATEKRDRRLYRDVFDWWLTVRGRGGIVYSRSSWIMRVPGGWVLWYWWLAIGWLWLLLPTLGSNIFTLGSETFTLGGSSIFSLVSGIFRKSWENISLRYYMNLCCASPGRS